MLAEAAAADPGSQTAIWIGLLVVGLSSIATLGVNALQLFRAAGGRDGERQIEPTQFHALSLQLTEVSNRLVNLERESATTKQMVESINDTVDKVSHQQIRDTENIFKRINAISNESAVTANRLSDHMVASRGGVLEHSRRST
jgi:hypothetical protein